MAIHVVNEAKRCLQCKNPRCRTGCPINTPIPDMIRLFRENHLEEAGEMLFRNNPLSVICSLVCDHEKQCEGHCVLGIKGAPVHISSIENYISDSYLDRMELTPAPKKGQRVAIIGSGPAGITIAVLLAQRGYDVTLFESREKIGGVLRYGIPAFRLPKEILDRYKEQLLRLGIKIRPNTAIGQSLTVDDLQRDGYQAIFIGTGVWRPKKLGIPGESLGNVHFAIDYLVNPDVYYLGSDLVVIGAGNSAMDVARTALRKGVKHVTVFCRRNQAAASVREVEYAIADGVEFLYGARPVEITDDGVRYSQAEFDADGNVIALQEPRLFPATSVVVAVSQGGAEPTTGLKMADHGLLATDGQGHTTRPGIFASGDVVLGARTVVEADTMTQKPLVIQIKPQDNVAVAVHDLDAGVEVAPGVLTREPIPQAHKIALRPIAAGGEIVRYGEVLGYAKAEIAPGSWINEHMLTLPESPSLKDMPYGTHIVPLEELPLPTRTTWRGYRNAVGPAGTRNLLGIVTTVQCAAGVLKVAVERIRRELLPKYPNVDGVVAVTHPYGCGVAINAPMAKIPIRAIRNLIRHPNFGGEIMVVGLGCEKLTYDRVLEPEEITPENVLTLQDWKGHDAMMQAILDMANKKLQKLNRRRREELPLSELLIGMQCGGSDAFSGITANPSAGYAADMLVRGGATVLFSEVTEVRDGVPMLAARCVDAATRDRLAEEMQWYDDYLDAGGVDRDANPTPGNKKGGLANILEKAMGSIAKSGTSPIVEVLSPAEKPTKHGLIYAATPASDTVCGPSQLASCIGLQVFMTGRGTPYGLDVAPVIKVCSRNELKEHWFDLIDISAGDVATGDATIADVGRQIFDFILDVASGDKQPYSDRYGFHNDLCIFNPAPIT